MILVSNILVSIIVIIAVIALGVGIFFLIKYNSKKLREADENLTDKTLSKADMNKSIASYIKKVGRFGDFSLIYIDIDNFSNTNDLFGKEQCDEFLTEIANRFSKRYPYRTLISKYNNDEFLIFIKENLTYEQVCKVCENLLSDVRQKLFVSTTESIVLTASAGICLYPSCGRTVNDLIKNLELATYISKREGGNKYTVYYSNLAKEETSNFKFFQEVKQAIANKEFCLYYQPIMNLNTNDLFGFEALMRWNHPEQGVLPPAKFINIMEQSGDIYWVGKWGLELLTKELIEVQKIIGQEGIYMSLNLSNKQLTYESLADDLILVAKKSGVNVKNIILEISGYTMFEKMENVKPNLLKLRDFGFVIAVDGFELDYSTLTRIQKEPIDMIKLNRSFLDDIKNNDIKEKFVNMLVESAKLVNRRVVCEGVETKEQEDYVKKNDVSIAQGYYYSKPMPEAQIEEFIRFRKWEENMANAPINSASNDSLETNQEASNNAEALNSNETDLKEDNNEVSNETNSVEDNKEDVTLESKNDATSDSKEETTIESKEEEPKEDIKKKQNEESDDEEDEESLDQEDEDDDKE